MLRNSATILRSSQCLMTTREFTEFPRVNQPAILKPPTMPAPSQIIVLGSINTDLVIRSSRLPGPGETVIGGEFYQAPGGKGANQAVAAARAALAPVTFIGAIGDDILGRQALVRFKTENLNCD